MFTYVCQNIIRALIFIFTQAIIHFRFALKVFLVFQNSFCTINTITHFTLQGLLYVQWYIICILYFFILTKAEAGLIKQQLFNDCLQYLSIGASLWHLNFSTPFEFPIWTENYLNLFVSCVSSHLRKQFLYKSGSCVLKFTSIQ